MSRQVPLFEEIFTTSMDGKVAAATFEIWDEAGDASAEVGMHNCIEKLMLNSCTIASSPMMIAVMCRVNASWGVTGADGQGGLLCGSLGNIEHM